MTRLATRPHPAFRPRGLPKIKLWVCVAAVVGLLLLGASLLGLPTTVPRLSVVNPGVHQVHVEVTDARRAGWLGLGSVEREATQIFEEAIDQGEHWVFRFSYAGVQAGELVIARSALEANSWQITVPPDVGDRLRAAGIGPSSR